MSDSQCVLLIISVLPSSSNNDATDPAAVSVNSMWTSSVPTVYFVLLAALYGGIGGGVGGAIVVIVICTVLPSKKILVRSY